MLDTNLKKNARQVLVVILGIGVVVIGISVVANLRGEKSSLTGISVIAPRPTSISETYQVKASQILLVPLKATYAPARLHGSWMSSRPMKAGLTHDLVRFSIVSPSNKKLYTVGASTYGKFDVTLDVTGEYTIELDNAGMLRETPRDVKIEATLEPR